MATAVVLVGAHLVLTRLSAAVVRQVRAQHPFLQTRPSALLIQFRMNRMNAPRPRRGSQDGFRYQSLPLNKILLDIPTSS